ncbi:MAG: BMP family ABC transporter substrate-binding protein [Anaerolineae bacterium]
MLKSKTLTTVPELTALPDRSKLSCIDEEFLCVGLVTAVGVIDDNSFNQAAWEGVERSQVDLLAEIDYIETGKFSDIVSNIKYFGDQHYDVIVTVGSKMNVATFAMAEKYPHTHFIGVDQDGFDNFSNATGLVFPERKLGFNAGALAAGVSRTGTVGIVLPSSLSPAAVRLQEGFEAGVNSISPETAVMVSFHPGDELASYVDPEWGALAARQMLENGADVIFSGGGTTGNGALVETAIDRKSLCIGIGSDQWLTLPEAQPCLISSATKQVADSVFNIIARTAVDQSGHHNHPSGEINGKIGLAPFHDLKEFVSAELQLALNEITDGLNKDLIQTDGSYIHPFSNISNNE